MVRSAQGSLTLTSSDPAQSDRLRQDLLTIVRNGIDAASPSRALTHALRDPQFHATLARPLHIVVAGKAAASMAATVAAQTNLSVRTLVAVGTHRPSALPSVVEWHEAAHPLPDERSVRAGRRVQAIAANVSRDETLLLLLSGGASALLAVPANGVTLEDKQRTIDLMMRSSADIHALNTVRKHLSDIKGGQLATATPGATLTLAVSDVMDDDVSVIGSGPGVADGSTWSDAAVALERFGGDRHPSAVRHRIAAGCASCIPDTPKSDDPRLTQASGQVIASRQNAIEGARVAASMLGYTSVVLPHAVVGEARDAARHWHGHVTAIAATVTSPLCVISAGETTVHVKGTGRGGRNQEFALALAQVMQHSPGIELAASVGTDGVDGPTDAAGAFVDPRTIARARALNVDASASLDANDSFAFFEALNDLIRVGRTDTNVGDLQVYLRG